MRVSISDYKKNGTDRKVKVEISKDDTFSLDVTLAHIIKPALEEFKKQIKGYPESIIEEYFSGRMKSDKLDQLCTEKWKEIIQTMIDAFELIISDDYYHHDEITSQKITKGLDNFSRYYNNLWW